MPGTKCTFAALLALGGCGGADGVDAALRATLSGWDVERFWQIELEGRKVGWLGQRFELREDATPPVAISIARARMWLPDLGPFTEDVEITYALRGEGEIVAAAATRSWSGQVETARIAPVADGRVRWTRRGGLDDLDTLEPRPRQSLRGFVRLARWLAAGDDQEFAEPIADWWGSALETTRRMRVTGRRAATDGRPVHVVTGQQDGVPGVWELRPDGALHECDVDGWRYRELPRDEALWFDGTGMAVFTDVGDPNTITALTLRWRGVTATELPRSRRQSCEREPDGAVRFELRRETAALADDPHPLADAERARWLAATPLFEKDEPTVVARTRRVLTEPPVPEDLPAIAERLVAAVRDALETEITDAFRPASAVLARGRGDCKDATVLFVAMARAAGHPARLVRGLVLDTATTPPSFVGHAWAELHDGRQWIGVDPAFGQVFVGATHVALGLDRAGPLPGWDSLDVEIVAVERDG